MKKYNINFGLQPVSNRFLEVENETAPHYELEIIWNKKTGCPSIKNPWPVDAVRPRFNWITCFEPEDHLDELCDIILNLKKNKTGLIIAGYSFKDDSTLSRLYNIGFTNQWRINPEEDLLISNPLASIESYQSAFNRATAKNISKKNGCVDLFIVRHVVEHAYNLSEFIDSLKILIKEDGYIVFELPDCQKAFQNGDCTTIWEEHIFYFFENSFKQCLQNHGLKIVFWKTWDYALENCMVAIVKKQKNLINKIPYSNKKDLDFYIYKDFLGRIEERKNKIYSMLQTFTLNKGKVSILGAGHLSIAFISLLGVQDFISFALDDNKDKSGYFLPIGNIPIKKTSFLSTKTSKLCLLGANPQHHKKIMKKLNFYKEDGGIFCSIFPNTDNYLEDILK